MRKNLPPPSPSVSAPVELPKNDIELAASPAAVENIESLPSTDLLTSPAAAITDDVEVKTKAEESREFDFVPFPSRTFRPHSYDVSRLKAAFFSTTDLNRDMDLDLDVIDITRAINVVIKKAIVS